MDTPDLESLLTDVRTMLRRSVVDAKHEWHLPVVSTIDLQGRPTSRTVVLRRVEWEDGSAPILTFHTDVRSRKPSELQAASDIAWLFYDRRRKVQLRVSGVARIHHRDAIADEGWERTSLSSRRCYLAPNPPSMILKSWDPNLPAELRKASPDQAASEAGRDAFAVVSTSVGLMERLELHHDGHLRSQWTWSGGSVQGDWLAP